MLAGDQALRSSGGRRVVFAGRFWALGALGVGVAALAGLLGWRRAALGVLVGLPVGLFNHGLAGLAVRCWDRRPARGAAWVMGAFSLRMVLAGALLWWAAGRGPEFLVGALVGVIVEMLDYLVRLPSLMRGPGRDGGAGGR